LIFILIGAILIGTDMWKVTMLYITFPDVLRACSFA